MSQIGRAIRDFADKHGPSGPAWNISQLLDHFRGVTSTEAPIQDELPETQAWNWVADYAKHHHSKDNPVGVTYVALEMVNAFLAGRAALPSPPQAEENANG